MQIDDNIFESIVVMSGLTVEDIKSLGLKQSTSTDKPTLKPNPNLGEGTASKDETDYRKALIGILGLLYVPISKIVKDDKLDASTKVDKINTLVDYEFKDGSTIIKGNIKSIFDNAVTNANNKLKDLKKDIPLQTPNPNFIKPVITEQSANLDDIANSLKSKLADSIYRDDIQFNLNNSYKPDFNYLNTTFNATQSRLDGQGWYGWYQSNNSGLIGTYKEAIDNNVVPDDLVADWETAGDDSVCDDCQAMAEAGPYSVLSWPPEQHFGDRCEQGALYSQSLVSDSDKPSTFDYGDVTPNLPKDNVPGWKEMVNLNRKGN